MFVLFCLFILLLFVVVVQILQTHAHAHKKASSWTLKDSICEFVQNAYDEARVILECDHSYVQPRIAVIEQSKGSNIEYFVVLDSEPDSKISLRERTIRQYHRYRDACQNNTSTGNDCRMRLLIYCSWQPDVVAPEAIRLRFNHMDESSKHEGETTKSNDIIVFKANVREQLKGKFMIANYGREITER